MPRLILNPSSAGASSDWFVNGATTAWDAVLRESDDSSFLSASSLNAKTLLENGGARKPVCGTVTAVTLHVRLRKTSGTPGGTVDLIIVQAGTERLVGTESPVGTHWVDKQIRIREDWTTTARFTDAELYRLGVGVKISVAPTIGGFEVSRLWLEIEYVDTPYIYDPYSGSLPDAIVGPLAWATTGAQSALLINDYLQIRDISVIDNRQYNYTPGPTQYREDYNTEVETRFIVTSAPFAADSFVCFVAGVHSKYRSLDVNLIKIGGVQHVGIISALANYNKPSAYLALAPLDFLNVDRHFRFVLNRRDDPNDLGNVQLFVDYDETPLLETPFFTSPATGSIPSVSLFFGTAISQWCTIRYDYWAWKTYKRLGQTFNDWDEFDLGTNDITLDDTDSEISRIIILHPINIPAGQSNQACLLGVNSGNEPCEISQAYFDMDGSPTTYTLTVDYKSDYGIGPPGKVTIQRCSDLWYWDDGTTSWISTPSSVDLPINTSRTRLQITTGLVNTNPEAMIIKIGKKAGVTPPYSVWLYKVLLETP